MDTAEFNKILDQVEDMNETQLRLLMESVSAQHYVIRQRHARKVAAQLDTGSRVRIVGNIKPKYLAGLAGTVDKLEGSKVHVRLDCGPINRFRTGVVIFRSAAALEVI